MRKACKQPQSGLAELRDVQVMSGWVRRLKLDEGAKGLALGKALDREERRARHKARAALADFPRKRWKRWKRRLPKRAQALPFGEPHFAAVALRRLKETRELDRRRRRNPSRIAYHRLRVALKRFRYTLESFLPGRHDAWTPGLKLLQRLLGEVHDLDVLRARIIRLGHERSLPAGALSGHLDCVERARAERAAAIEKRIVRKSRATRRKVPPSLLWDRWRRELEALAAVNLPDSGALLTSLARAASPEREKSSLPPGRRRRLS